MGDLEKLVAPTPQKAVERSRGGTTTKKLKAISHRKLLDQETGEVVEVGHVELQERDANFEKIWLGHIIDAIDEIGSKKIEVLMWLFRNRNADNIVIATNKQIAEEDGSAAATVKLHRARVLAKMGVDSLAALLTMLTSVDLVQMKQPLTLDTEQGTHF